MSKDIIVKSNRLNMAIQHLTLPELRIIQLAIIEARESGKGLSADMPLRVDGLRYAEAFETTRQNAYLRMKQAEETLFNRRFSFLDESEKPVKSRWISQIRYLDDEGSIELIFTPAVVKCISRIDGAEEFFTQYLLTQTAKLTSLYSVRLYELLVQWKHATKTPVFPLDTFRGQLGLIEGEYKSMNDFKKRVLDLAVNEINKKTDLTVSYTQQKKGRLVSGFAFDVKVKKKGESASDKARAVLKSMPNQVLSKINRDADTLDLFSNMTEKQISAFSYKLARMPELGNYCPIGADYDQYAVIIGNELRDGKKQAFYKMYLEKLGFKFH